MKLFVKLFGPYPLSTGYTVVVTDDDLEIPLEAQGISIFGANHCDGQRECGAADRPRAGAPVVRQLGDRPALARHLAARGLRLLRRVAVVGGLRRPAPPTSGRATTTSGSSDSPQDLLLSDPGPRDMFDDRVYKRGALTLHALRTRHRRRQFLCAAAGLDHPAPPLHRGDRRLHRPGRQLRGRVAAPAVGCVAVLHGRAGAVTDAATPTGPITRGSVARVGTATVLTALCGYAVLYLAARDLEPAGFSVFGVFWGAFGLVTGAANGLLQEATREVRSTRLRRGGVGPAHPSDAGGGDGRCGRGGGDRGQFAAVVGTRLRRVAAAQRRAAERGAGRVLPARHPARACWPASAGGRSTAR